MILKKALHKVISGAGISLLILGILYPLRWTLFEGIIQGQIRKVAQEQLKSDILFGEMKGSLLSGIEAKNVIFVPEEGSPLRKATFGEIRVDYGFLGMGTPKVTINGALIMMARSEKESSPVSREPSPPERPSRLVQTVMKELHQFNSPGEIRVRNALLVFSDGTELDLEVGELLRTTWAIQLQSETTGRVKARGEIGTGNRVTLDGTATKGPIRWLQVEMNPLQESHRTLKIFTEYKGHRLAWDGKIRFQEKAIPTEVEGRLTVREGRVEAKIDFESGIGILDVEGIVPVDEEVEGNFTITGHAEGPLDGTKEQWTVSEVSISAKEASFQKTPFEDFSLLISEGTLEKLFWKGTVKNGPDHVSAEGTFEWGNTPRIHSTLQAEINNVTPYRQLFPDLDLLDVTRLKADGMFTYNEEGPYFDGTLQTDTGRAFAFRWETLRCTGQFDRNSANLKGLTLTGTPLAPQIDASGMFNADGSFYATVRTEEDQIEVAGTLSKTEGFDVEYLLEGPMKWLEYFKVNIPREAKPFYFQGIASGNEKSVHIQTALVAGDMISASPQVTISRSEDLWNLELSEGSVLLQGREQIRYGKGKAQIRPGYLALSEIPLTVDEPDLAGTIWGQAEWNEERVQADLHLKEVRGWGSNLGTIRAFGGFRKESGNVQVNLNWGNLSSDHLMAQGIFGKSNDFSLNLHIGNLNNPALRNLLPGVPLEGEVALQLDVLQKGEEIMAEGAGILDQFSVHGSFPISIKLPITSGTRSVAIPETQKETPYGTLRMSGKIPLPWTTHGEELNLLAILEAPNFDPIFQHFPLPEEMKQPQGEATIKANIRGSLLSPETRLEGEIRSKKSPLPLPLGELSDVHLNILYDGSRFQLVDGSGKMGGGPFHLSGEWITSEPNQPLRVQLRGEELLVVQEKLARIRIDPEIELRWNSEEGCKVTGNVELPFALYYHEFGPKSDVVPVRTVEAVVAGIRLPSSPDGGLIIPGIKGFGGIALDVTGKTTGECRIENSEIGILIQGDVRMRGTGEEPSLSGTITSKQGEFKLSSGIFLQINSARVDLPYSQKEDGIIDFKGTIGQGDGRISVILNGPIALPRLNLQSYPPRPQQELLARVAFGQAPGALTGTGALGTLAVKVLEQITDDWPQANPEDSLLGRLKLSIVDDVPLSERVSPWELPPAGSVQGTRVRTEYLLNSFLSVIAETDEDGNVSGDLKVRWNFR